LYYDFQAELPNRPEVAVVGPNSDRQARSQRWFDFAKRGPPTRNWPFSLLPDDFFHSVVLAQVNRSPEVNASRLTQLRNLQWLSIYRTPITKPDWKNIGKLKTLKVLLIWPAKLDNEGPKSIAALRELEQLTLQGPGITDSDIQCVCGLEKLVFLTPSRKSRQ
jgi:hypothetical protein